MTMASIVAGKGPQDQGRFEIQLYYEDTDFSGVVYHANYLKYFERARDSYFGLENMKQAYEQGRAVHVYKVENLLFKGAALHSEVLVVETTVKKDSDFRICCDQRCYVKSKPDQVVVTGKTELVCVDVTTQKITKFPDCILNALA